MPKPNDANVEKEQFLSQLYLVKQKDNKRWKLGLEDKLENLQQVDQTEYQFEDHSQDEN